MTRRSRIAAGLCLAGLAALGAAARAAGPTTRDEPAAESHFVPAPSSPLMAFRLVVHVGSKDDPAGKEGLAALTAAMVAEGGSKALSHEEILEKFYPMAASLDGACRKELTVFQGTIHGDNAKAYGPIVGELIATPRFAPEDFERLRNEALDYVTKTLRGNNDEELGKWTLQCDLYEGHPYGHPDLGTVAGLRSITLEDVKEFHRKYYNKSRISVVAAGGSDGAGLDEIRHHLDRLRGEQPAPTALPVPKSPQGLEVTIVSKPAEATAISIGFPIGVTRADDDFYALAVANSFLGEHRTFNGKLMQDLRGKRGLNYGDYSYIEDFIQEGGSTFPVPNNPRRQQYFSMWVRPVPRDKAVFALRAALWEHHRLVENGMSPAEFEATRSFLLNYSKLWVQTLSRRIGYQIDGGFYGKKDLVTELAERLPKLTLEQVNAAVRRHLKPAGMRIAIVAQNAEELRDLLVAGTPTPIAYDTQGTPEEILGEDRTIAAFPLKGVKVRIVPVDQMFEK
ncbi:M16 family metallopeptidase [Aquisphaera insulae]|uniref:M16 family metallopeptidase n=1 Tax=Aquisphaera insulae TaxID=2712864 RepID=UPI0013EB3223|nr:pitrilysin family protein [Aquisphaera insulae]